MSRFLVMSDVTIAPNQVEFTCQIPEMRWHGKRGRPRISEGSYPGNLLLPRKNIEFLLTRGFLIPWLKEGSLFWRVVILIFIQENTYNDTWFYVIFGITSNILMSEIRTFGITNLLNKRTIGITNYRNNDMFSGGSRGTGDSPPHKKRGNLRPARFSNIREQKKKKVLLPFASLAFYLVLFHFASFLSSNRLMSTFKNTFSTKCIMHTRCIST